MSQADAAIEIQSNTQSGMDARDAGDLIGQKLEEAGHLDNPLNPKEEPEVVDEIEEDEVQEEQDSEAEEVEDEESDEDSEKAEQEPEADTDEALGYESVEDLAAALEMSVEDFLKTISIKRKIDGVEEEVTLEELRNGNQRDADYRRKTMEFAEQRKAFEQEVEQVKGQVQEKLHFAEAFVANLEEMLTEEYQGINWNQLELEDKQEWLIQRQKYGEKYQQIQNLKSQLGQQLQERQNEVQQRQQAELEQYVTKEAQALVEKLPEWNDEEVRTRDRADMLKYIEQYGFSEQDMNQIMDHRLLLLVRDASKAVQTQKKVDIAKKKVKTLPKFVKPGVKQSRKEAQQIQQSNRLNKAKKSGSIDELGAVFATAFERELR